MGFPFILTIIVFAPLLGVLLLTLVAKTKEKTIKTVAILSTLPSLFLSIYLIISSKMGVELVSYSGKLSWMQFGNPEVFGKLYSIDYELGVDGFSLILLLLTALLSTLAAFASFQIKAGWKGYYMLFLLLEVGMLGVFAAENLILFFIFFEVTLVATFFLIGKWGLYEKERTAFSLLIYNGMGSAILLVVIMVLFAKTGTANIDALMSILSADDGTVFSSKVKTGLLIALFIAFGIKLPIWPFHSWMVKVHSEAPAAIVMLHAGVLLKIGAYGLIHFGLGFFPKQFESLTLWLAILGVINLLYGAFLALSQQELRKILAYSSISHMGIVLIGLAALNEAGIQGAMFQVVSHGLIAALFFYLIGIFYERYQSTSMADLNGLAKTMPIASGFLLVAGLASLGLPGMSGFVAEFLAFLGLFQEWPVIAVIACLGIILTAVYILRAVLGITFGQQEKAKMVRDMTAFEIWPAIILLLCIVGIGVYPDILSSTLKSIIIGLGG